MPVEPTAAAARKASEPKLHRGQCRHRCPLKPLACVVVPELYDPGSEQLRSEPLDAATTSQYICLPPTKRIANSVACGEPQLAGPDGLTLNGRRR
jgi:hypothetical protein